MNSKVREVCESSICSLYHGATDHYLKGDKESFMVYYDLFIIVKGKIEERGGKVSYRMVSMMDTMLENMVK